MGSNFGPYQTLPFYKAYERLFSTVQDVCFRDESSYAEFKHLPNVRTAPDVVFSMDTKGLNDTRIEKSVIISVIDLSWRDELVNFQDDYENSILKISEKLIERGYKVVLMSFCQYEGDENAINRILSQTSDQNITKYFYDGDIEESIDIINHSSGVIATRFHSMILGWIFKKPVFPFIYSNKTLNVLNDIEYDGYSLEIEDIASINIDKVISQTIENQPTDVSYEIERSHENFSKFDQFMSLERM